MTEVRQDLQPTRARTPIPPREARVTRRRLSDTISHGWIVAASVAWPVLYVVGWVLEPTADNPDAVAGTIESLFLLVFLGSIAVMARGFSLRQRFGFAGSLAAAGVLLAAVIACPITGHHAVGGWWYGQLTAVGGLVAISAAGLRAASRAD